MSVVRTWFSSEDAMVLFRGREVSVVRTWFSQEDATVEFTGCSVSGLRTWLIVSYAQA